MRQEILAEWNPWWSKKPGWDLVPRVLEKDVLAWLPRKEIIAVLGVRRSGKTTLFKRIISHLLAKTDEKNILFIKGDDERIEKGNLIQDAIDTHRQLFNPKGRTFIFIDEVQDIPSWESTLKRIHDLEPDAKFFISGSNSSLLLQDLSKKIAGRYAYFDLYPFSFGEYLDSFQFKHRRLDILSKKQEIIHHLLAYMEFGGFPEVVLEKDNERKTQLLQFYFDSIVYRDILRRQEIRNTQKMERLITYYLQNISNLANFTKIAKQIALTTDSVVEYTLYLQDAFFVFSVPLLAYSIKKQEINPKKIYCVDTGLRNIKGFRFSPDVGRLAENAVFLELKRRQSTNPLAQVLYWSDKKHEIDFVYKEGIHIKEAMQICWDFDEPSVKRREIDALFAGLPELKLSSGIIITKDAEQELHDGKLKIYVIPLWKWLLQEGM
ncbi:MAG: ATP-binding protein [Nanoarchaeota archaeon]